MCVGIFLTYVFTIQKLIGNMNFLEKPLKFVYKAFYLDQAFWDFLYTYSTYSAVCKKRLVNKSFEFLVIKKNLTKNLNL